jgi:hypothetical protein
MDSEDRGPVSNFAGMNYIAVRQAPLRIMHVGLQGLEFL